ncbi:MAG: ATP synthase F0 subunit B [Coleofasciculus sp. G3-WIS-01]|uniref:ATP synthase F0 subunit B n=1 Tax=Coleofasciculus sp. G3-WIS-01 TaxID=3069528 RepID=UPI003303BE72
MLRPESSRLEPDKLPEPNPPEKRLSSGTPDLDIQRELTKLEDMLFDSPHIPLTKYTLIDEEAFLTQLDVVRASLPEAFEAAKKIIHQGEDILLQTEDYAQEILEAAERQAQQILDDMGIVQQAELEAKQIRQRVQQECETLQQQTRTEIEQMRRQAQQELVQLRQLALEECEDIQNGADDYADSVLNSIEQQLTDMLRVIRNGRQQLYQNVQPKQPQEKDGIGGSESRSSSTSPKKKSG